MFQAAFPLFLSVVYNCGGAHCDTVLAGRFLEKVNVSNSIIYRRATDADYAGVLQLQEENLRVNLSDPQTADGFLMRRYTEEMFRRVNNELAIVAAVAEGRVVGYLCAKCFPYAVEFPVLKALISHTSGMKIGGVTVDAETAFIYGPVCVSRSVRGTGVLAGMWTALREIAAPYRKVAVLFIADANRRSLRAHEKLGMTHCGMFVQDGNHFHALAALV